MATAGTGVKEGELEGMMKLLEKKEEEARNEHERQKRETDHFKQLVSDIRRSCRPQLLVLMPTAQHKCLSTRALSQAKRSVGSSTEIPVQGAKAHIQIGRRYQNIR